MKETINTFGSRIALEAIRSDHGSGSTLSDSLSSQLIGEYLVEVVGQEQELDQDTVEIVERGSAIMGDSFLNKGTAFTEQERSELGLLGLLPYHSSTIDEQTVRDYENFRDKESDLQKYIYLTNLQDRNETLFFRLCLDHITEMMPIIYTPVVGAGCEEYSHIYRRPHGLFVSYPHKDRLEQLFDNLGDRTVDVIVVTDGERILGLGDLGVGGMGIPVGKLSLYTICAGIHPATTLAIALDVGTDNEELLNDPLYLGWRHKRIRGAEYDEFVERFVRIVNRRYPNVLLQWEDFSKGNAARLLTKYHDQLCTFNDDIQGTGAVTLAGLLAAVQVTGSRISEQRVLLQGAGSSANGICRQIATAMIGDGLTLKEAQDRIWLVDSQGLVHSGRTLHESFKIEFAKSLELTENWKLNTPEVYTLADVIRNVHPTILLGTSAQPGAFTEAMIRDMAAFTERPIIFPLSNPTSKSEATPIDLMDWTNGKALIATGSPFPAVHYGSHLYGIGQCNNAFIFPGVGLGIVASKTRRVTNEMFVAAARALSEFSPSRIDPTLPLFPNLESVRDVSFAVALAVAMEAIRSGNAEFATEEEMKIAIREAMWEPHYPTYRAA